MNHLKDLKDAVNTEHSEIIATLALYPRGGKFYTNFPARSLLELIRCAAVKMNHVSGYVKLSKEFTKLHNRTKLKWVTVTIQRMDGTDKQVTMLNSLAEWCQLKVDE